MEQVLNRKFSDNMVLWLVYYLAILFSMVLVTKPDVATSSIIRYFYVLVVFVPALIKKELFPFVVVCFCAISRQSFSPILPSAPTIYLGITLFFFLLNYGRFKIGPNFFLIFICLYFIISCYLRYDVQGLIKWLFTAIVLCSFVKDNRSLFLLGISMIYVSLFLSLLLLVFQDSFMVDFEGYGGEDLERVGWINPNEFGAAIACGLVVSVGHLLGVIHFTKSRILKILCYVNIVISTTALLLNASRGCVIAAISAVLFFVLLSNKSKKTKAFLLISIAGVSALVMQSEQFVVFTNRIQDAETIQNGSGRLEIWETKLREFKNFDFFQLLIGIGQKNCNLLGGRSLSTHNDFVTALIGYGIVGLCLLLYIFILPLRKMNFKNRAAVIPLLLFLLVECFVMEPLFRGNLQFYMLYAFILFYSESKDLECINEQNDVERE